MKTLAITLCVLLVIVPAGAQQTVQPQRTNFYVPYGIRDHHPQPFEEWSSSAVEAPPPVSEVAAGAPLPQRVPARRGGYRQYGPRFNGYQMPERSPHADAIWGLVIIGLVALPLIAGDR